MNCEISNIHRETLAEVSRLGATAGRRIQVVYLRNYFSAVQLCDGSVGTAMSYFSLDSAELCRAQAVVDSALRSDPLLMDSLFNENEPGLFRGFGEEKRLLACIRTAVLSALSSILVANLDGTSGFRIASDMSENEIFGGCTSAVVIGFGGYLEKLVRSPAISFVHVSDLSYRHRRSLMDLHIQNARLQYQDKIITISDGRNTADRLRNAELVSITGSAICNDTMEGLLSQCEPSSRVIVQGQSACIYPTALFDRGVDLLVTSIKPPELISAFRDDPSDAAVSRTLEQGLDLSFITQDSPEKQTPSRLHKHWPSPQNLDVTAKSCAY